MYEVAIFYCFAHGTNLIIYGQYLKKIKVKPNHNKSAFQLLLYNIEIIKKSYNI